MKYTVRVLVLVVLNIGQSTCHDGQCEPADDSCLYPQVNHYTFPHGGEQVAIAVNLSSTVTLNDGVKMPLFGLGVCCVSPDYQADVSTAVTHAVHHGYRMIDTAASYNTEAETGQGIRDSGVPREDIFVVTKLWYSDHGREGALRAFNNSFHQLGLDYVDLYLIHAPYGGRILETYDAMLDLKKQGLIRSVGVSNFGIQHLEGIKQSGRHPPSVNQIELHPWQRKEPLVEYCRKEGIAVMGYSPLTRGIKLQDPHLVEMASRYGVTTAQLLIRWGVQSGFITIPKSFNHDRITHNSKVFHWTISDQDMNILNSVPDWSCSWDPTVEPWEG